MADHSIYRKARHVTETFVISVSAWDRENNNSSRASVLQINMLKRRQESEWVFQPSETGEGRDSANQGHEEKRKEVR